MLLKYKILLKACLLEVLGGIDRELDFLRL